MGYTNASRRQHTTSGSHLRGPLPSQHIGRPRPLISISSTGSDAASRRRSAILELDQPFRNSLQRAQDALRASERSRYHEERRARTRSTHFAEPPLEARRRSTPQQQDYHHHDYDEEVMQSGGNRSGRKLHKSRSIPLNLLTSPSPKLQRHDTTASHAARIKSISPPRHSHQPRRTASFGDLLASPTVTQQPPTSILQTSPTYTAPRPAPIPAHLPVPEELTSKFSGSSGESKLDPSTWEYSLRARARTISQAVSFKSLKKTPSKLTLRKKNSLATLFDGVAVNGSSRRSEDDKSKAADFKSRISTEERRSIASSKIPTSSRNSTSSYSQPPSSPSVLDSGGKHRRGFLRNALKDLSRGNSLRGPRSESRSSHARSASNSSVSVVGSASKRASDISSKDSGEKKGWVSRLGKAVSGKRVAAKVEHFEAAMNSPIDSPTPMVHLAERVRIPGSGPAPVPQQPTRIPSRIPITAVFPRADIGSTNDGPRRSAVAKESSDDTTFYGHSIPEVTVRARAARSTRRTSIPVPSKRFGSTHLIGDPYPAPSGPVARPAPPKRTSPPATLSLLPALALRPTESTYSANLDAGARSDSSGNEDLYAPPSPSPNRRSFRAPSLARFRDFVESESASSSPEKNARGLPQPGDGSPRSDFGASPKKRAMGPEQIVGMVEDSADEGIVEARGATTDLAALLSDLEETQELTASGTTSRRSLPQKHRDNYADLSASLRQHLPIIAEVDSVESLRSTVSDVPDDLRLLIRSVSDHISEMDEHSFYGRVEEEHDPSPFAFGDGGLGSPFGEDSDETSDEEQACFDDNEGHAPFGSHHFGTTDDFLDGYAEGSGGSTTGPLSSASPTATSSEGEIEDSTAESFEGHISTAAMALRAMLSGSGPGEPAVTMIEEELELEDAEEEHSRLRDSVRDYLEMERPTLGEKMLDDMDMGVSLTSLIGESPAPATEVAGQAASSPAQHLRNQSNASSSEGFSECGMGSPTPASRSGRTLLRHSMVRYSQDRSRPQVRRRGPSTQSAYDDSESELEGPPPAPDELTSSSFTHSQSSHATNVSISSLHSSPCPAPRSRRIPMLTRRTPVIPDFHFPPLGAGDSSANSTIRGPSGGGSPWTQTHSSSSPSKAQQQKSSASPFKRLFNPLEEFRARSSGKRGSGSASEEDSTGEIQLQEALAAPSPRFVRPLQPAKSVPRPRPLSSQSLTNAFVPPDTPPPSSPSIAASDAGSSSESGGQLSAFRSSFDLDRQHPPIVAAVRGPKGHSRQVSRSSSIIRDVIPEDERETLSSPISYSATTLPLPPTISPIILEQRPLEVIEEPVSPIKVVEEEPRQLVEVVEEPAKVTQVEFVPQPPPAPPQTFALSFAPAREAAAPSKEHLAALDELDVEDEFEEIFDLMDDEVTQTVMRNWVHFHYEAEMEIRRSQARWPDTDASREAVARFKRPATTHDILHFLFDSQNRFHSRVHHGSATPLPNLPSPAVYPHHAVSPPTPNVSSDGSHSKDPEGPPVEVSPPSPSPIPVKKIRMPLGAKPVNRQLVLTKSTSSPKKQEPALSPFTALPPKLGLRLRSKLAAATTSPKKMVDVGFLEGKSKPVTRRRKDQFDAARRKLEGLGAADEQRSDGESESENSGVIEAKGEGSAMGFARTPKLTSTRPRVRRKQGLSMLR